MKSTTLLLTALACGAWTTAITAHDIEDHAHDDPRAYAVVQQAPQADDGTPAIAEHFQPFEGRIEYRWDGQYFYVDSDGMPSHQMMVGITAWQQQVPIPQNYTGLNAWRIPLRPVPAREPMSAKHDFFRGAIALAVNGVPIFNPIKNDGKTDTYKAGELDDFGGHAGRGDDYHYHIAPTHLAQTVGDDQPIAYALDGYAIYSYREPDGSERGSLDALNGHEHGELGYHYHATKDYPYLNGGFHGRVTVRDGQVDPQPRSQSPRPSTRPLRGATITGFDDTGDGRYGVTYRLRGKTYRVNYVVADDGSARFTFIDPDGTKQIEDYPARKKRDSLPRRPRD